MGGASSSAQDVVGLEHYAKWTLPYVRSAFDRAQAYRLRSTDTFIRLSRFQFWEVFTDYSHQVGEEPYLRLPLSVFSVFAVDILSGEVLEYVDAVEVCLILGMFGERDMHDKHANLNFLFDLFDLDGSGEMERPEMKVLMRTLDKAAFKVGITPRPAREQEIEKLSEDMFRLADADGGGDISRKEFVVWSRDHLIGRTLINAFDTIRTQEEAKRRQREEEKKRKLREQRRQLQREMRLQGLSALSDDQNRKLQAKNRVRAASNRILQILSRESEMTIDDLRLLRGKFAAYTAKSGTDDLSRSQFKDLMFESFPALAHVKTDRDPVDSLFDAFDTDNSNSIDFKELAMGVAKLVKGSKREKLQLMFDLIDDNGDGNLDMAEVVSMIEKENADLQEASQFTEQIVRTLDKDGDGRVSKEEFAKVLAENPLLYDIFAKNTLPGLDEAKHIFADARKKYGKATSRLKLGNLQHVYQNYFKKLKDTQSLEISLVDFRRLMRDEFAVPPFVMPVINRIFHNFDKDKSGTVSFKELFAGLGQVLGGTIDERAEFYFTLYDIDGSGAMSRDEVLAMVLSSQEAVEDSAVEVKKILDQLDKDGDGSISREEFKAATRNNPQLLECFGRLFGVEDEEGKAAREADPYANLDRLRVERAEKLLSGDDGGAKGSARVSKSSNRGKGLAALRKMSQGTLSGVVHLWQVKAEDRLKRAEEVEANIRKMRARTLAATRAVSAFQSAIRDPSATASATAANDERGSARESNVGEGAGGGSGSGGGSGGGGGDDGSSPSQPGQNDPPSRDKRSSLAHLAPGWDQTLAPVAHVYLNCHASVAAREHGRLVQHKSIPNLRNELRRDMYSMSDAITRHAETRSEENPLLHLYHGTRPKSTKNLKLPKFYAQAPHMNRPPSPKLEPFVPRRKPRKSEPSPPPATTTPEPRPQTPVSARTASSLPRRGASNGADTQRSVTTSVASSSSATRTARADPGSSPPSSKGSTQGALVAKSSNGSLVSTKGSVVDASDSPPQTASTRALRRAMTAGASLRATSSFGRLRPTTSHARLRAQRQLARTESALTVNAGGDTLSGASLRARRQRNRPATTAAQRSTVAWTGPQHPSVHRARGSTMGQRTGSPDSRGHPAHSLASTGDHRVSVTQLSTLDKYDFLSPAIPFAAAARRQRDTKLRGSGSEASLPYSPLKPSGASVSHNQVTLPRPRTHSSIRPPVNLHPRPSSAATASPVKSRWPATSSSGHSSPEVVTRGVSSKQSSSKATKYHYFAPPQAPNSTLDRKLARHQASHNARPHTAGLKGSGRHLDRKQRATKTLSKLRMAPRALKGSSVVNGRTGSPSAAAHAETQNLLRMNRRYRHQA